ncbi:hypothetical protein V6N13_148390 [Hibiscus sabdariffa]
MDGCFSSCLSKYVVVGDEKGKVYVFLRKDNVATKFHTKSRSPIMEMISYILTRNPARGNPNLFLNEVIFG